MTAMIAPALLAPALPAASAANMGNSHNEVLPLEGGNLPSGQVYSPRGKNLDAELIARCAEHIRNMGAYNADKSDLEPEENPLWAAYERTRDAISDARPQSIYGLLAKARAAVAEAAMPDGSLLWRSSTSADWAADLTLDLLRLDQAGALPALEAPPAPDQTACFITLLAEVEAADAALNRAVVAHSRNEGAEAEVAAMEAAEARYEAAMHRLAAEPARDALGFAVKGLIVAREVSDLLVAEGRLIADSLLADVARSFPQVHLVMGSTGCRSHNS